MKGRRVLITGGAGFLGSALANRLSADNHVVVLDDFSRGRPDRLSPAVEVIDGDIRDGDVVWDATADVNCVVHMAMVQGTQNFTENPWLTQTVAVEGTLSLLKECRERNIRDFMLISSSEVYQGERDKVPTDETVWLSVPDVLNPRFSYGGGKIAMELLCTALAANGDLDRLIIARPHNIYGPDAGREHIIPQFALRMKALPEGETEFPILGTGQETRSYCYIDDCTDALELLLDKVEPGVSIWHVGTEDERTSESVAHAVAECFNRDISVVPAELPKGSPPRRCPDTRKIEALGYRPKVSFEEGIRRACDWYRDND